MKKLLLLILFLILCSSPFVLADGWFFGVPTGGVDCSGCNTGNDSQIDTSGDTQDSDYASTYWRSWAFTTADTKCFTAIFFYTHDGGNGTGATCEIYTDSAGDPGSIADAGATGTVANLPDTMTNVEFAFAAAVELAAGNYHLVWKPGASTSRTNEDTVGGSSVWKYSDDNGSTWVASSIENEIYVYGCDPS